MSSRDIVSANFDLKESSLDVTSHIFGKIRGRYILHPTIS